MTEIDALIRIAAATALGAALGLEREVTGKPAGLRTHMLVAEGAALFFVGAILITQQVGTASTGGVSIDVTRIGSTIVTGVGFLGGGMILRSEDRIYGLTTAAGIWVAAAIGMLCGGGYFLVAVFGTALGLMTLTLIHIVERITGVDTADTDVEEEE